MTPPLYEKLPAAESMPSWQSGRLLTVVRAAIKALLAPIRSTNSAHKPRALRQPGGNQGFPPGQPPPIGVPCLIKRCVYHGLAAESLCALPCHWPYVRRFGPCSPRAPNCGCRRSSRPCNAPRPSVVNIRGEKTLAPTGVRRPAPRRPPRQRHGHRHRHRPARLYTDEPSRRRRRPRNPGDAGRREALRRRAGRPGLGDRPGGDQDRRTREVADHPLGNVVRPDDGRIGHRRRQCLRL